MKEETSLYKEHAHYKTVKTVNHFKQCYNILYSNGCNYIK